KKCPACRTVRNGSFRSRKALSQSAFRRTTKTHCEKKDRGWETQLFRLQESPATTGGKPCPSAPVEGSLTSAVAALQGQAYSQPESARQPALKRPLPDVRFW